jgi:replicative DNA helicase
MSALAAVEHPALTNIDTEAALLGALMHPAGAGLIDVIADRLTSDDFAEALHGRIFAVILQLHAEGKLATPISLKNYFVDDPDMKELGGPGYLAQLIGSSGATIIGARDFAREIADLAKRRRLIEGLLEVVTNARSADKPIDKLVDAADTALTRALQQTHAVATVSIAQAFDATMKAIEDEAAGLGPQGIKIAGLDDFNELTGDLRRGELMYVGGRPSMGKTALAMRLALGAAETGNGVALISLEMRAAELTTRAMSDLVFEYGESCPSFEHIRRGRLGPEYRRMLVDAREKIDAWPLLITDPPTLNIGRLAMEIRRQRRKLAMQERSLDLVIVDYLGLIKGDPKAKRFEEVGEISRTLKQIAKECDVALVVLAQLNRECEKREDKRPMLSDLRDAGDIEQDADHVMFVYRDEYYLERSEPDPSDKKRQDWEISMGHARDRLEIILAKARNGRVGKRTCYFFGKHQAVRPSGYMSGRGGFV